MAKADTTQSDWRSIGWQCGPCGWKTFSLDDMHRFVNWPNPDGSISLVCPRCGAEGQFIDAFKETTMAKFRKKPVVIEAMQWTGGAAAAGPVIDWVLSTGERCARWDDPETETGLGVIAIDTLEGTMLASPGDWIIRGVSGEHYPCKPDIFEQTYEAVDG